jgi:LytR cell envelope-related transcriptional attenuator
VEHSLPQIQTPWRTATVVLSAVALLQFVILLVLTVVLLAEPVSKHVTKAAQAKVLAPAAKPKVRAAPTLGAPELSRAKTTVIILNGNGLPGAAAASAERVRRMGYSIGSVGNAPSTDFVRSVVMYRRGHAAEGRRLARDLGIKVFGPLDGMKQSQLLGAHAAVIVGG